MHTYNMLSQIIMYNNNDNDMSITVNKLYYAITDYICKLTSFMWIATTHY